MNRLNIVNKPHSSQKEVPEQQAGFSLVEMIMVLVLIGTLGSIGTLGLTTFLKNFAVARQGTETSSAGQMAILRIAKELVAVSDVNTTPTETNGTELRFTSNHGGTDRFLKIELSGTDINLIEYADNSTTTATSTDLLANNVAALSLQYYDWVSDNDTLSTTPTTTWSSKEADNATCTTAFSLVSGDFSTKECDDDDGDNRQKIQFDTSAPNYSAPYILYYGGVEYFFCTKDGEYRASEDATGTGSCESNGWDDDITDSIPYYDTIYVYPESNPECYKSFAFTQEAGDECSSIGNPVDNPVPDPTSEVVPTLNGSRLIDVSLQMEGLINPFTISIAPRNI